MQLISPKFEDQDALPQRYTCDGVEVSPPLEWRDVPEQAVELVFTCVDPDAPNGTFGHWAMWGVDPALGALGEDAIPSGSQVARNDFGITGYGGACPPRRGGAHHYEFHAYALSSRMTLPEGATVHDVRDAVRDMAIDHAEIVATYAR